MRRRQKKDMGPTFYVTFDFTSHLGVEADAHIASVSAPADIGEDSYLIGPRYVIRHKRFEPYFKALFGIGVLSFQSDNAPHYFAIAIRLCSRGRLGSPGHSRHQHSLL
jgi:hypothetical protein